jgi:hypothetical protein
MMGKSLDKSVKRYGHKLWTPDENEAAELATRALVYRYIHIAATDIEEAMDNCESPIERIMFGALVAVASKMGIGLRLVPEFYARFQPEKGTHPAGFTTAMLTIVPQSQLGDYRVDFLLTYEYIDSEYPVEALQPIEGTDRAMSVIRPELEVKTPVQKNLIVECDGHDFHEKTKQQAIRDKRRDRILQSLGYRVFRFTGSEIHNDAIACAVEAFKGFGLDPDEESDKPMLIIYRGTVDGT